MLGLVLAAAAWAHPGIDRQIRELTERIDREPRRAELYLRRGELHRVHRDWTHAEADFRRARKLDPSLAEVDLALGRLKLDRGQPRRARTLLDRYVQRRPEHAAGWAGRGRSRAAAGDHLGAAEDFGRAIELAGGSGGPELYIEQARALAAAGDAYLDRAIRGLDDGLDRLGRPVTLELQAIELEVESGRHDDALARVDRLATAASRPETWLARRAEILEDAGRDDEARVAWNRALEAIRALPDSRRGTRALQRLEQQARQALARLASREQDD